MKTGGADQVRLVESDADLSDDELHRFKLWRTWDQKKKTVLFVMLNPSTANATEDDPTIRKCIRFAQAWGYGGIQVGNLFSIRTANPAVLHRAAVTKRLERPRNDRALEEMAKEADLILAAWGNHGARYPERIQEVLQLLRPLHALRVTKLGQPSHPLYLPNSYTPRPFCVSPA